MALKGTKLYSNGIEERYFSINDDIPEGFVQCKLFYINNGQENKRWYNEETIPKGFVKGKLPFSRNWNDSNHKHHSEETKKKISESRKLQANDWWIGRHHTEESKQKISKSKIGKDPHNKGKCLTEEQKQQRNEKIISKYGSLDNYYSISTAKNKQTKLERYGNENYNNREKAAVTTFNNYGVDFYCMTADFRKGKGIDSIPNNNFSSLLEKNNIEYIKEFPIHRKQYDFKVGNILIEINPSVTHNSTFGVYNDPPKDKYYHYNKSKLAEENNFRCIQVWEWDDINKIISLLKPREKIYARNCSIKEISKQENDDFLNINHLQGTCNNQTIRLGLYYNNNLVQVITFGLPRYNKKYDYELLRLCSLSNVIVIGGAQKLFKYFLDSYNPKSIISYCDRSKFRGDVYTKLGFKELNKCSPSKHWFNLKTHQHITDNLLRQRGFDQLFNTSYGKGTSNEELMKEAGFVEIYDCGQQSFVLNKR